MSVDNNSLKPPELLSILRVLSLQSSIHGSAIIHDISSSDQWVENIQRLDPFISHSVHILPILTLKGHWCILIVDPLTKPAEPSIIYCDPVTRMAMPNELKQVLRRLVPRGVFNEILTPVVNAAALSGIAVIEICRRLFHWIEIVLAGFTLQDKEYIDPLISTVESNNVDLLRRRLTMYRNDIRTSASSESSQTVPEEHDEHALIRTRSDYFSATQVDLTQLLDDDERDSVPTSHKRQRQE